MTIAETALALGISPRAVRFRIAKSDITAVYYGKRSILIAGTEVERAAANPIKRGPRRREDAQ